MADIVFLFAPTAVRQTRRKSLKQRSLRQHVAKYRWSVGQVRRLLSDEARASVKDPSTTKIHLEPPPPFPSGTLSLYAYFFSRECTQNLRSVLSKLFFKTFLFFSRKILGSTGVKSFDEKHFTHRYFRGCLFVAHPVCNRLCSSVLWYF